MLRRALLVDDNLRFLEVARRTLEQQGLPVVGTATTADEALAAAHAQDPDVVLVDVALGRDSGIDLTRRLVAELPRLTDRVVLISTRDEDDLAELVADSPAVGFLAKSHLSATAVRDLVDGA